MLARRHVIALASDLQVQLVVQLVVKAVQALSILLLSSFAIEYPLVYALHCLFAQPSLLVVKQWGVGPIVQGALKCLP